MGFWLNTLLYLSDRKGSETMPTLQEFKDNLLALLDIINNK